MNNCSAVDDLIEEEKEKERGLVWGHFPNLKWPKKKMKKKRLLKSISSTERKERTKNRTRHLKNKFLELVLDVPKKREDEHYFVRLQYNNIMHLDYECVCVCLYGAFITTTISIRRLTDSSNKTHFNWYYARRTAAGTVIQLTCPRSALSDDAQLLATWEIVCVTPSWAPRAISQNKIKKDLWSRRKISVQPKGSVFLSSLNFGFIVHDLDSIAADNQLLLLFLIWWCHFLCICSRIFNLFWAKHHSIRR